MPRVPNYKAKQFVLDKRPFHGLNIFAWNLRNGAYCVFSFTEQWPLYLYYAGNWYGNGGHYSRTTSRHRNLLRPDSAVVDLPRAVIELFVHYCHSSYHSHSSPLNQVLYNAGLIQPPAPRVSPPPVVIPAVTTHLARATVDWGAVHRRRVVPVL